MTKKEIKRLAKEIARNEKIVMNSTDSAEVNTAKDKIMRLTESIYDINDMVILDCYIQDYLSLK